MGKVIGHQPDKMQHKAQLYENKSSLHGIYHELQRKDNYVTAEKVKNEFLGVSEHHETLLNLFQKHNEDFLIFYQKHSIKIYQDFWHSNKVLWKVAASKILF